MADLLSRGDPSGRIVRGPDSTLVGQTIHFICSRLHHWRDDPHRHPEQAEDRLNLSLCDFLDSTARKLFPMVRFSREEPQSGERSADMAAKPLASAIIHGRNYTKYDAFLVIEGKRLPSPPPKAREREYVSGAPKITGGIQRFKLGLHGGSHHKAVLIGYVQSNNMQHWWKTINEWITDLSRSPSADTCLWDPSDALNELSVDYVIDMAACTSNHSRSNACTNRIEIEHFWIVMGATGREVNSRVGKAEISAPGD